MPYSGRHPALALAAQEAGHAFFQAGGDQHLGVAKADQARALGLAVDARFDGHGAQGFGEAFRMGAVREFLTGPPCAESGRA
jgi:hypothetical protein